MMHAALLFASLCSAAAFQAGMPLPGVQQAAATRTPAVEMMAKKNVPSKNVWVTFADSKDCKPGSVVTGFQYGLEVAIVTDRSGGTYACANKLPPTGQPASFAEIGSGTVKDPISGTTFSLKSGAIIGKWCPSTIGNILARFPVLGSLLPPQKLDVFPCRKGAGSVQVLVNVNAKAQFEQKYWRGILDAQGKVDGGYY